MELILGIIQALSQLNPIILGVIFLGFIVIAYKIFQALMKAFIVGVISATFPVVANLLGMDVPLTISSVVWFAVFGVTAFMLYASIAGGAKMAGFAMKPFTKLFSRKPVQKIIIREKEKS